MVKKITTATGEQWRQIAELKERWIANTTRQYSIESVHEVVERMYSAMELPKPIVLVAPSPASMVLWSAVALVLLRSLGKYNNQLSNQLRSQLRGQLSNQLSNQLRSQLSNQLSNQLRSQLYSQLDNQLRSQLYSQLDSQLSNQLRGQLSNQLDSQLYSQLSNQLDSQLSNQLDSQLSNQLSNQLRSQLYSQLDSQLSNQLYSQLDSQLSSQLDSQLRSQLDSQLSNQLDSQLSNQLDSQLSNQLSNQLRSQPWYIGLWYRAWSGWYLGGQILGVEYPAEQLNLFIDWNERASTWVAYKGLCVVSANPVECHWQDGELHNDSGMSVEYADGWGIYSIGGVAVDEQIVMRPETQSLDQVRDEENAEVKRIRIDRYGWSKYLMEIGAKVLDTQHGNWIESLMKTADGMTVLCTYDPSTGRPYGLEVDPQCETCEQAQRYLLAPEVCLEGTGLKPANVYPVLRT